MKLCQIVIVVVLLEDKHGFLVVSRTSLKPNSIARSTSFSHYEVDDVQVVLHLLLVSVSLIWIESQLLVSMG